MTYIYITHFLPFVNFYRIVFLFFCAYCRFLYFRVNSLVNCKTYKTIAKKHNIYIIEDDYDSEFRFDGSPIQSMQSFDLSHVIYVSTFSKTLMPGIRLGYMILPNSLCEKMRQIKYITGLHSPTLEQLTMAKFIHDGHFNLHIHKMCKLYLKE